ncbi:MAG TPA: hypothetical protein VHA14_14985 [Bryobacteraceae bacterium]|nr:hypothetical protein [Bryobacteraceae bacterium]
MSRYFRLFAPLCLLSAAPLFGQIAFLPEPLPTPLKLPPGNIEVLQIDTTGSYMGDAVRIVDCPKDADEPFGTCGNELFGGPAIWNSHLSGAIQIKFYDPVAGISHFEVTHPFNLTGNDTTMTAPQMYIFPVTNNVVLDTFNTISSGDLNLITGQVTNLTYSLIWNNLWYGALGTVNPQLKPPAFTFPGTYGMALANFAQRPDGLLDFTFYGSTFLPLGSNTNGDPVRIPMALSGPYLNLGNIQVPGMSLHPHIRITTVPDSQPACDPNCIKFTPNSTMQMTLNPRFSAIGDDYTLNIPQLGFVPAGSPKPEGHSEIQGTIQIQFGQPNGNYVPVIIRSLAPNGLLVPPPTFPIPGLSLGFFGADTHLKFPLQTFPVVGVVVVDDPFDFAFGDLDLTTGQIVGGLTWRSFWDHTLLDAVLAQNATRGLIPFSFQQRGPAQFQTGPNGEYMFRYDSTTLLPFTNYIWPNPDYTNPSASWVAGPGSYAQPFVRIQAALSTDTPTSVMSGGQNNIKSTYGETFTYQYSIPCSGTGAASFTYSNNGEIESKHGGTFTLTKLSAVSCINSLSSTQTTGNYDSLQFTAYGKWSHDSNPHIATVNISTNPSAPYVSVLIDGSSLSNADTSPAVTPVP